MRSLEIKISFIDNIRSKVDELVGYSLFHQSIDLILTLLHFLKQNSIFLDYGTVKLIVMQSRTHKHCPFPFSQG